MIVKVRNMVMGMMVVIMTMIRVTSYDEDAVNGDNDLKDDNEKLW